MAPKTLPPVYNLPHAPQVDLLAQALLREYMHQKGYRDTLQMFDEENPRNGDTISSRAVMSDLMQLTSERLGELKSRGIETIMESLCMDRVEKRSSMEALRTALSAILPDVPPEYLEDPNEVVKREKAAKEKKSDKKSSKKSSKSVAADGEERGDAQQPKKKKKHKLLTIDELLDQNHQQLPSRQPTDVKSKASTPSVVPAPISTQSEQSNQPESAKESTDSEEDYAVALRKIRDEEAQSLEKCHRARGKEGWGGTFEKDVSDTPATTVEPQWHARAPKLLLGIVFAQQLKLMLVGSDRRIPSSFAAQGFFFNRDVDYGLVQNEGGPCGVLAAVQGFLLREFSKSKFILTDDVKKNALVQSWVAILMRIQPDTRKIVVASPAQNVDLKDKQLSEQVKVLSTFQESRGFTNRLELEAKLTEERHMWCAPQGLGLLAFVVSAVLTRGLKEVAGDMDVEAPLIVEHGYCSQEIVNLVLQGAATSGVHDGVHDAGGMTLHGIRQKLPVGVLTFLEHRHLVKVGSYGKYPESPIWVVYNESHYSVIFMKNDVRSTSPEQFDVFFYDQQGGQDSEMRITVSIQNMPLPAVKKDDLEPYLHCILRTVDEWALARFNWNGADPLL